MKRLVALVVVAGALAVPGGAGGGDDGRTEVTVTDAVGTVELP